MRDAEYDYSDYEFGSVWDKVRYVFTFAGDERKPGKDGILEYVTVVEFWLGRKADLSFGDWDWGYSSLTREMIVADIQTGIFCWFFILICYGGISFIV